MCRMGYEWRHETVTAQHTPPAGYVTNYSRLFWEVTFRYAKGVVSLPQLGAPHSPSTTGGAGVGKIWRSVNLVAHRLLDSTTRTFACMRRVCWYKKVTHHNLQNGSYRSRKPFRAVREGGGRGTAH